jgi:hypothetical protein
MSFLSGIVFGVISEILFYIIAHAKPLSRKELYKTLKTLGVFARLYFCERPKALAHLC